MKESIVSYSHKNINSALLSLWQDGNINLPAAAHYRDLLIFSINTKSMSITDAYNHNDSQSIICRIENNTQGFVLISTVISQQFIRQPSPRHTFSSVQYCAAPFLLFIYIALVIIKQYKRAACAGEIFICFRKQKSKMNE